MHRQVISTRTKLPLAAFGVALLLASGGYALSQSTPAAKPVPDAQVESNVLRALAGANDLASQPISTTTVYGVVTLSGSVATEPMRTEAENIASHTSGVQKVVDEMTVGVPSTPATSIAGAGSNSSGMVLQSDGTMAPAPQAEAQPSDNSAAPAQQADSPYPQAGPPSYGPGAPEYRRPYASGQRPPYPPQANPQAQSYPQEQGYGPQPRYPRQQAYAQSQPAPEQGQYGGQQAGEIVTVAPGAMIRIRINQSLDSSRTQPGTKFDGIVVNDVVAGGAVAIPRGAAVQGTVVDAKSSGALSGRGELALQLTSVTLAGQSFPITSDIWTRNGGNKATESVNKTILGGAIGALVGAAAAGGKGAAIGAGVGGAVGLGSSAASGNGQMYIPSEGLLSFRLSQPATVATVSQEEMNRLSQGVPMTGGAPQPLRRRMAVYPAYGPLYYPAYPPYRSYPYPYPY